MTTTIVPTVTIPLDLPRALVAIATTDEKTGVLSYRAWREQAQRGAADGSLRSGAVLMVDVDRFAAVNARNGHLGADAVLSKIAETLTAVIGSGGAVGTFGGDEFVALASVDGVADARRIAENARQAIADLRTRIDGPAGQRTITGVTVSIGVAVGDGSSMGPHDDVVGGRSSAVRSQAGRAQHGPRRRHSPALLRPCQPA